MQTIKCTHVCEQCLKKAQGLPQNDDYKKLIPAGRTIIEDARPSKFEVKDLEFISFLKDGEDYVSGGTMRIRAKGMQANMGLADLQKVLDNQNKIPKEMQDKYLVFPGTVVRNPSGSLDVPVLCFGGKQWCLDWFWLEIDWGARGRLPRIMS